MNPLKKLVYGDEKLTLKEQVAMADDLLDIYISQLNDLLPDVDLWMGGSVLWNRLSVGCGEKVKIKLLPRKRVLENALKCTECGREHDPFVKRHVIESFIRAGKEALKEEKSNGKVD